MYSLVWTSTKADMSSDTDNKSRWRDALSVAFPEGIPPSASWTDLPKIIQVLKPFCARNLNQTMLPRSGGIDIITVRAGKEPGCIELCPSFDAAYVARAQTLRFEHIPDSPWNSFFLLETGALTPSGVYENLLASYEELLELPNGTYKDRACAEDESPDEEDDDEDEDDDNPFSDQRRIVVRYFSGKFLMVAKSSLWNRATVTYDGRHNRMSAGEIRSHIVAALNQDQATE